MLRLIHKIDEGDMLPVGLSKVTESCKCCSLFVLNLPLPFRWRGRDLMRQQESWGNAHLRIAPKYHIFEIRWVPDASA